MILRGAATPSAPAISDILAATAGARYTKRIAVRRGDRTLVLPVKEIEWIEADGNYVRLHAGGQEYTIRATMHSMESELDPSPFARIHRQTIVNVDRIAEVSVGFQGDYFVVLRSGRQLDMQRSYAEHLRAAISRL